MNALPKLRNIVPMDRVRPVWDHTEDPKPVGGRAADRPGGDGLPDGLKCRVRLCNILERFQLLQFTKYSLFCGRKDGGFLYDHLSSSMF